jgi:hypothetical protein
MEAMDSEEDEQNRCCKEENICEKVTEKASLKLTSVRCQCPQVWIIRGGPESS